MIIEPSLAIERKTGEILIVTSDREIARKICMRVSGTHGCVPSIFKIGLINAEDNKFSS
jgi:predicted nucleic acid-binding protein